MYSRNQGELEEAMLERFLCWIFLAGYIFDDVSFSTRVLSSLVWVGTVLVLVWVVLVIFAVNQPCNEWSSC